MKEELLNHRWAYGILFLGLFFFTLLFLAAWPNHWSQRMVAVGIATFYASWGILFHLHVERISRHVVREYLAVSIITLVVLFIVTG